LNTIDYFDSIKKVRGTILLEKTLRIPIDNVQYLKIFDMVLIETLNLTYSHSNLEFLFRTSIGARTTEPVTISVLLSPVK